ncbi:hypothetical protein ORV05_16775 [Amycolatopsis cynarae]|uniref:Zf-HC2 domain-containing protein n=1 Tax=Amycolatopsis cynarae TaxID=2995223 RepID=A0ABY7BDL5_9PSEU|nr:MULTISPECIES: hypothetical protein [Amycolatopsis]WAL69352.1 hypothetical protein ORV05_16775 [Amycolatopsis sp. HUAS 11-8]
MSDGLKSPAPDAKAMRDRVEAVLWRWLAGDKLTDHEQLIVDMRLHRGGCATCR